MVAHVKQAMVYALIVALTFVGSWLLFGREMEAEAVSAPIERAAEPAPLIFEASDRTCVYLAGQLECFCTCADDRASCAAPSAIRAERLIITAPPVSSGTEDGSAGITRTVEVTETESTSAISRTMSVIFPGPSSDTGDDPNEKPKCNQGVGNGPEDCSPGKSDNTVNPDHPHGPNDEGEDTGPGNPGRKIEAKEGKEDKDK